MPGLSTPTPPPTRARARERERWPLPPQKSTTVGAVSSASPPARAARMKGQASRAMALTCARFLFIRSDGSRPPSWRRAHAAGAGGGAEGGGGATANAADGTAAVAATGQLLGTSAAEEAEGRGPLPPPWRAMRSHTVPPPPPSWPSRLYIGTTPASISFHSARSVAEGAATPKRTGPWLSAAAAPRTSGAGAGRMTETAGGAAPSRWCSPAPVPLRSDSRAVGVRQAFLRCCGRVRSATPAVSSVRHRALPRPQPVAAWPTLRRSGGGRRCNATLRAARPATSRAPARGELSVVDRLRRSEAEGGGARFALHALRLMSQCADTAHPSTRPDASSSWPRSGTTGGTLVARVVHPRHAPIEDMA